MQSGERGKERREGRQSVEEVAADVLALACGQDFGELKHFDLSGGRTLCRYLRNKT